MVQVNKACLSFVVLLLLPLAAAPGSTAADAEIAADYVLPIGVREATPAFFTFQGLREAVVGPPVGTAPFTVTKASLAEFPALAGQGVSMAVLSYAPGGVNPLHTHPRAAELLLVLQGTLEVGLVDSGNRLFRQVLVAGDAFVFPKGLVHFQANWDRDRTAIAVSAFGSANAGTVSLPTALFASGIDEGALARSFKADVAVIASLVEANRG